MAKLKAKLLIHDKEIDLPFIEGSIGYSAVDVSSLHSNAVKTFDPGFFIYSRMLISYNLCRWWER